MRTRAVLLPVGLSLLLAFAVPGPPRPRPGFGLVRLIDRLGPQDFRKAPLARLLDRFERAEEAFLQKDLTFIGADPKTRLALFVYPLKRPALGVGPSSPPAEVSLRQGSKTLPFAPAAGAVSGSWSFFGRAQSQALKGCLYKGLPWTREILVPKGGARLTFVLSNPQPGNYLPRLRLLVDGRTLAEEVIRNQGRISAVLKTGPGRRTIELRFDDGRNLTGVDERGAFLKTEHLLIDGAEDMILLTLPRDAGLHPSPEYRVSYLVEPGPRAGGAPKPPDLADAGFLYHTLGDESQFLLDRGAGARPGTPFRKVQWGGGAVNVILAPPPTKFSFTSELAGRSFLEFGCGLLRQPAAVKRGIVSFKVILESGEGTKTVFQKELRLGTKDLGTAYEPVRVDLAKFTGRRVRLTFAVEARGDGSRGGQIQDVPAFWANPILFTPVAPRDGSVNVILISLDTLRADHLGCYGYPAPTSPNLDKLAADGVRFKHDASSSSWTLPSHMSLLTSRTPAHHGVLHENRGFDPSIVTLADVLREGGYVTGAFTAGGYVGSRFGFSKGFDFYFEGGMSGENPRAAEILSRKVTAWLGRNADKKFFLFLHTYQPHDPYSSPAPWGQALLPPGSRFTSLDFRAFLGPGGDFKRLNDRDKANVVGLYDGDIRCADEAFIGPLVRLLRSLGLYDRTLIVVTSDHGEEFFDHGSWLHGQSLYEEMIHVPLIFKMPGSRPRGLKVAARVQAPDVMPTILDVLGVPAPGGPLDGRSLLPLLKNKTLAPRDFISETYGRDEFPSPLKGADPCLNQAAVTSGPYKLIYSVNDNLHAHFFSPPPRSRPTIEIELYDLDRDPGEERNLAAEHPDVVRRLLGRLEAYFAALPARERRPGSKSLLDDKLTEQLKAFGYIR
jgi:arylsulfatase A-like enzyme